MYMLQYDTLATTNARVAMRQKQRQYTLMMRAMGCLAVLIQWTDVDDRGDAYEDEA